MKERVKAEILAVDDHCLILEGISRIVNKMPDVVVADAVTSGREALELIAGRNYDAYILDVSMPDMSGFDLIMEIREWDADARIIVYTMHEEIWIINRLVQCKVNAVVLKSSTASDLVGSIRSVLRGEPYVCPRFASIRKKLHCMPQSKDIPTKREQDVLRAVAKGLNTHEIAGLLGISENTVETFRKKLISKFGAKNAIDLVVKAVSQGWVSVP